MAFILLCGISAALAAPYREDAALLQLPRQELSEPPEPSAFRPNTHVQASLSGLNFALDQSKDFVAQKIVEGPLIPGNVVSLGFGINLEIGTVWPKAIPDLSFSNGTWTEGGVQVDVEIQELVAEGSLKVSTPYSTGSLQLRGAAGFRLGLSTGVNGSFSVRVVKLNPLHIDLTPTISLSCAQEPDAWTALPCSIISALQGDVPGWLVDSMLFLFDSQVQTALKAIIELKLNENLHSIPTRFPLRLQNAASTCLELDFRLLGLSHSTAVKTASFEVLATDTCTDSAPFPVPGLTAEYADNMSMFSLTVSGSVPNSVFKALDSRHVLHHVIYPEDVPGNTILGLNSNALSIAFYCPWLLTKYAFDCPAWRPCNVSATVRAVLPEVELLGEALKVHIPLSVDFNLLGNITNGSKFLWRINATATASILPSITATSPSGCDQVLHATFESLEVTWIDVTKTQDDSWVATALTINVFLSPLLDTVLLGEINKYLAEGIPLRPMKVGETSYALKDSSFITSKGKLTLSTDVVLAEDC